MSITKAVIPAGGLGTRFLPASKAIPKELVPIVDKPTIQYIVEEAADSGIRDVVLITSRGKGAIEDHFDTSYELEDTLQKRGKTELLSLIQKISSLVTLISVRQQLPKGLGHAVLCGREAVGNEPFAVLLGDDIIDAEVPCVKQMMKIYEEKQGAVLGIMPVPKEQTSMYGILEAEKIGPRLYKVTDMVEKPSPEAAPSNLAIVGRYILPPEIFPCLESIPAGHGGEIQLTDGMRALLKSKPIYGYEFEGNRYDAGDKLGYLQAILVYAMKNPELGPPLKELMREMLLDES